MIHEDSPNEPKKENNMMIKRALWSEKTTRDSIKKSLFKTRCRDVDKV